MSTISSASRPPHKRPHIASPTPNNQIDDHSSKRQKTVRTYTSTSTTTTTTSPITNINGRHHHPPPFSSSSIVSSEFSSQPDTRGPALPADFFDTSTTSSSSIPTILPIGGQNRNTSASHAHVQVPIQHPPPAATETTEAEIDEDEWAAFQADIAETEDALNNPTPSVSILSSSAVITAAPTGPGGNLSTEEDEETRADEAALDREEAQNKLVEEFEEMESLESRVQKLKEQREALRAKATESAGGRMDVTTNGVPEQEDDDEDDEEEDDWIHFSR